MLGAVLALQGKDDTDSNLSAVEQVCLFDCKEKKTRFKYLVLTLALLSVPGGLLEAAPSSIQATASFVYRVSRKMELERFISTDQFRIATNRTVRF